VFVSLNSCFEEVLKVLLKLFFLFREEKRQEEDHGGEERIGRLGAPSFA
jgi:hypothetical protein